MHLTFDFITTSWHPFLLLLFLLLFYFCNVTFGGIIQLGHGENDSQPTKQWTLLILPPTEVRKMLVILILYVWSYVFVRETSGEIYLSYIYFIIYTNNIWNSRFCWRRKIRGYSCHRNISIPISWEFSGFNFPSNSINVRKMTSSRSEVLISLFLSLLSWPLLSRRDNTNIIMIVIDRLDSI